MGVVIVPQWCQSKRDRASCAHTHEQFNVSAVTEHMYV